MVRSSKQLDVDCRETGTEEIVRALGKPWDTPLGEMNPQQLRETTLDPATRTLRRITLTDAAAAATSFETMMGKAIEPRRKFIDEHALNVSDLAAAV